MSEKKTGLVTVEPGRKLLRKKTFTDALKEKYCEVDDQNDNNNIVIIVYGRRTDSESSEDGAELAHLRIAGLTNCDISHAGLPPTGLKTLCPNITELDLAGNLLTDWSEVLAILSNLHQLTFVNLSRNKLQNNQNCLETWPTPLVSLRELVLNSTSISWDEVISLVKHSPVLNEIHLCNNGYSDICEGNLYSLHGIETLRLNNNNIESWCEVWKLRSLPNLQSLILSGNPIQDIYYDQSKCTESFSSESKHSQNPLPDSMAICSDILEDIIKKVEQNDKNSGDCFANVEKFSECNLGEKYVVENVCENDRQYQNWPNNPVHDKNLIPSTNSDSNNRESIESEEHSETISCYGDDLATNICNMENDQTSNCAESREDSQTIKDAVRITVLDGKNSSSVTFSLNSDEELSQNDVEKKRFVQQNCDHHFNQSDRTNNVSKTYSHEAIKSNSKDRQFKKSQSAPELLRPFQSLSTLCLSNTEVNDWSHLHAMRDFPNLKALRITNITLASDLPLEERRKLYLSCLPSITVLNGGEITDAEREKAERYFVRHFIKKETKPPRYTELEKKHGALDQVVEIDLTRGFQEWVCVKFVYNGCEVLEDKIHMLGTVGNLREFIKQALGEQLRHRSFKMWHLACGPFHIESEVELEELFLTSLPLSRFDIQEGDEIHIELVDLTKRQISKKTGFLGRLQRDY